MMSFLKGTQTDRERQFAGLTDRAMRGRSCCLIAACNQSLITTRENERVKHGEESEGMIAAI